MAKKKVSKKKVKKTVAKKVPLKDPNVVQTFLALKRDFAAKQVEAFRKRFPR